MTRGSNPQAYGEATYWDNRYKNDVAPFDWYQRYSGLAPLLQQYIPKTSRVLMVGCGNASISEDMVNDGYQEVVNIDISTVVIEAMQQKYQHVPQLKYMAMDVRDLSALEEASFDGVIDKGMLDSLMCGTSAAMSAGKMLDEVSRVLNGGCSYILVTYGDPRVRMAHLNVPEYSWTVTLHVLPRPGSKRAMDESSSSVFLEPIPISEDGSIGPHPALEDSDVHFIYVCTKSGEAAKKGGKPGKK